MNLKELAQNLEMEEDEFLEMIDLFLDRSTSDLNQLESAVDELDAQKVFKNAHSVKGAAANLGLEEVYEVASRIERSARNNSLEQTLLGVKKIREELDRIAHILHRSRETDFRG